MWRYAGRTFIPKRRRAKAEVCNIMWGEGAGKTKTTEGLVGLGEKIDFMISAVGKAFCSGMAVSVLWIILPSLWRMYWKRARLETGGFCSLLDKFYERWFWLDKNDNNVDGEEEDLASVVWLRLLGLWWRVCEDEERILCDSQYYLSIKN